MSVERQDPIERLFELLAPLAPEDRRQLLDACVRDDPALRSEIESLLHFHDRESVLDRQPTLASLPDSTGTGGAIEPGGLDIEPHIGPYRVLEPLGAGGMGSVYLAEQTEPVRRRVAIKVMRRDVDSPELAARFETERQALAAMRSPHIVTLLDAGSTPDGRPYFVMEYVTGAPITEFCDRHRIDLRSRLRLFLQMCDGLRHAHERGVLHRDVKPANVLVSAETGRPHVKILDFGIAKIFDPHAPAPRAATTGSEVLGTPEYMSPEQTRRGGGDVDVRADVYSAGLVLHELLAGVLPARSPRDRGPERRLPPELERITRRAIEADRTRRYASIAEFASDCRSYLSRRGGRATMSRRLRPPARVAGTASLVAVAALLAGLVLGMALRPRDAVVGGAAAPAVAAHPLRLVTIGVPRDCPTIQAALDRARPGDTVRVGPGVYFENLVMKSGVVLESEAGPARTTIDGARAGSVIDCDGVASETVIRGFRLAHGAARFGGGIRCWNGASPVIEGNVITENSADYGGGIASRYDSFPLVRGCRIYGNSARFEGGGIYAIDGKSGVTVIQDNDVWANESGPGSSSSGGGVWVGSIECAILGNRIEENTTTIAGGGIWAGFDGMKLIARNIVRANSGGLFAGGIYVDQGATTVVDNILEANTARIGAGIGAGNLGLIVIRGNSEDPTVLRAGQEIRPRHAALRGRRARAGGPETPGDTPARSELTAALSGRTFRLQPQARVRAAVTRSPPAFTRIAPSPRPR